MAQPSPSSISLKTAARVKEKAYNRNLCIICQNNNEDAPGLSTGATGRASVKRAAELREDIVNKRIKIYHSDTSEPSNNVFSYHNTQDCFKGYVHAKNLRQIEKEKEKLVVSQSEQECVSSPEPRTSSRKNLISCAPPSCDEDSDNLPCVLCGNKKHNGIRKKHKLSERNCAINLIKAIKYNQDAAFTRTADRLREDENQCVASFLSADYFYHDKCMKYYIYKYNRDISNANEIHQVKDNELKQTLFNRAVPYFDALIAAGECCNINDAVEFAQSLIKEGEVLRGTLYNRDLKKLLMTHYGEAITIASNIRIYESDIFFSSTINAADITVKLKNHDIIKEAASEIRKALLKVDFGLQDSFCDSNDLHESWEKTRMPECLLTFLSVLYNVPKHKLFHTSAKDLEQEGWIADNKNISLHCLFRMMYYGLYTGTKKTPMQMIFGHSLYASDRS